MNRLATFYAVVETYRRLTGNVRKLLYIYGPKGHLLEVVFTTEERNEKALRDLGYTEVEEMTELKPSVIVDVDQFYDLNDEAINAGHRRVA